jgi:hypothetical protein
MTIIYCLTPPVLSGRAVVYSTLLCHIGLLDVSTEYRCHHFCHLEMSLPEWEAQHPAMTAVPPLIARALGWLVEKLSRF